MSETVTAALNAESLAAFGVRSSPTLLLFTHCQPKSRGVGLRDEEQVSSRVRAVH